MHIAKSVQNAGAGPRTLLEASAHNADGSLRLADLRGATTIVAFAVTDLLSGPPEIARWN